MSTVVPFERKPTIVRELVGDAKCLGCNHRWVQVAPVGTKQFECPACTGNKGMFANPITADVGDTVLVCTHCGSEALTAFYRNDVFRLLCMGCGVDQTEAVFG